MEGKSVLLNWVKRHVEPHGVTVNDFTVSWKDGMAFGALLYDYTEGIDFPELSPDSPVDNLTKVFAAAKKVGLKSPFSVEEVQFGVAEMPMIEYLSKWYSKFKSRGLGRVRMDTQLGVPVNMRKEVKQMRSTGDAPVSTSYELPVSDDSGSSSYVAIPKRLAASSRRPPSHRRSEFSEMASGVEFYAALSASGPVTNGASPITSLKPAGGSKGAYAKRGCRIKLIPDPDPVAEKWEVEMEGVEQRKVRERKGKPSHTILVSFRIKRNVPGSWAVVKTWQNLADLHKMLDTMVMRAGKMADGQSLPSLPSEFQTVMKTSASAFSYLSQLLRLPSVLREPMTLAFLTSDVVAGGGLEKAFPAPLQQGWLLKQKGDKKRKQAKRWCVLRDRALYYYRKEDDLNPSGVILLDGCIVAATAKDRAKGAFSLIPRASTKQENYVFFAEGVEDVEAWVKAIEASNQAYSEACQHDIAGSLVVGVVEARNLVAAQASGYSDPFVTVIADHQQQQTSTARQTLSPSWDFAYRPFEHFCFDINRHEAVLHLCVWSAPPDLKGEVASVHGASFLGFALVPVAGLLCANRGHMVDVWIPLCPRTSKERVSGELRISVAYNWNGAKAPRNPSKVVFGVSLSEAVRNAARPCRMPPLVLTIIGSFLMHETMIKQEYIFKYSNPIADLIAVQQRVDSGEIIRWHEEFGEDPHLVAGVLCSYLRSLPDPVFTRPQFQPFVDAIQQHAEAPSAFASAAKALISKLPEPNQALLQYLFSFLSIVASYSSENKMSSVRLGVVFAPVLFTPVVEDAAAIQAYGLLSLAVRYLIDHCDAVFGAADEQILVGEALGVMPNAPRLNPDTIMRRKESALAVERRDSCGSDQLSDSAFPGIQMRTSSPSLSSASSTQDQHGSPPVAAAAAPGSDMPMEEPESTTFTLQTADMEDFLGELKGMSFGNGAAQPPASGQGARSNGAQAGSGAGAKPASVFQPGQKVRAPWYDDGNVYDAVINEATARGYWITFTEYGNQQETLLADIVAVDPKPPAKAVPAHTPAAHAPVRPAAPAHKPAPPPAHAPARPAAPAHKPAPPPAHSPARPAAPAHKPAPPPGRAPAPNPPPSAVVPPPAASDAEQDDATRDRFATLSGLELPDMFSMAAGPPPSTTMAPAAPQADDEPEGRERQFTFAMDLEPDVDIDFSLDTPASAPDPAPAPTKPSADVFDEFEIPDMDFDLGLGTKSTVVVPHSNTSTTTGARPVKSPVKQMSRPQVRSHKMVKVPPPVPRSTGGPPSRTLPPTKAAPKRPAPRSQPSGPTKPPQPTKAPPPVKAPQPTKAPPPVKAPPPLKAPPPHPVAPVNKAAPKVAAKIPRRRPPKALKTSASPHKGGKSVSPHKGGRSASPNKSPFKRLPHPKKHSPGKLGYKKAPKGGKGPPPRGRKQPRAVGNGRGQPRKGPRKGSRKGHPGGPRKGAMKRPLRKS